MLTFLLFLIISPIITLIIVLIPFQIIKYFSKPKLKRDWDSLHKELPEIVFDKNDSNIIYIRNIRNAKYNPHFEFENKVEYLNKKYNLNNLDRLWIMVNPYGTLQSHVILSFQFGSNILDASFVTLSYEVRKTDSYSFNTFSVLYKTFEGYYLIGTEEDLFYVRTNVRKNEGQNYLYEINTEKEKIKNLFSAYAEQVNLYNKKAFKYNFLTRNCLTEILPYLASEKILKYNFFDYLSIIRLLYKNRIVKDQENLNYRNFLQKFKIKHTTHLLPDESYSLKLRFLNIKN